MKSFLGKDDKILDIITLRFMFHWFPKELVSNNVNICALYYFYKYIGKHFWYENTKISPKKKTHKNIPQGTNFFWFVYSEIASSLKNEVSTKIFSLLMPSCDKCWYCSSLLNVKSKLNIEPQNNVKINLNFNFSFLF